MVKFSLKTLAEDVLTLEINTIVKANMSACKMPSSRREALWSIAGDYHLQLVEYGCREPVCWAGAGLMAFLELYDRANRGIEKTELELNQFHLNEAQKIALREKATMLQRIKVQSEQLVSVFNELARAKGLDLNVEEQRLLLEKRADEAQLKPPLLYDIESVAWNNDLTRAQIQRQTQDLELDAVQLSLLRKIWEIGTERILLQTVIHVDGDVTTRVTESFLIDCDPNLLHIHQEGITTSVQFWSNLVKTIREVAASFFNRGQRLFP
ncbi:hypothetical protein [Thioflexithrix psekupsensis]|uniref:Uncharacterized protein n=1 Tax=Thioflexithrix psekupsensis TaxID=1570016 RepID=A0A251X6T6_9GAMM|nr:hypothetical protein [Thioflexithrix psekupsensis]OUD13789.1 hypothetical protein TPSD3_05400 [Thioflexithrix psekupsensis]